MRLEQFRKQLLAKEQEVLSELKRRQKNRRDQSEPDVLDSIDESIAMQDRESLFALTDRDTQLLRDIREALERMDEGTYGRCVEDGEMIGPARLKAIPWASHCVRHQAMLDETVGYHHAPQLAGAGDVASL